MNGSLKDFYNAAGVVPRNDPEDSQSFFAIDEIRRQLEQEVYPGMKVLDLGCGAGRYTFALEDMGAIPTGVDFADVPLNYARKVAQRRNRRSNFIEGDIRNLPFDDETFDMILFPGHNIVEHSYEAVDMIASQSRSILRPGGKFCLVIHDMLMKVISSPRPENSCDSLQDMQKGTITIPAKGTFQYDAYFWTVSFAKYIFSRYLEFEKQENVGKNRFFMKFIKARYP